MSSPTDHVGIRAAAFTAGALIAQQVVGKAIRDALFLTSFSAADLPSMMIVGALLSLISAVGLSRLLQRYSPRRILPLLFVTSAVAFAGEWALGFSSAAWMTIAFYIHMALMGPALLSAFWSLINEHYDPYSAKRAVARIAAGSTVGGVIGGVAVWRAADLIPLHDLLLAMAGIHVACVIGTIAIRPAPRAAHLSQSMLVPGLGARRGVRALVRSPLLRNLALVVAIGSATSSLLDYLLSSTATQALGRGTPLLEFFSLFWLGVAVASLVVQLTLGARVLERLGLARNMGALPGMLIVGGAITMALPSVTAFVLLRGFEAVQRNTLYRSAYELFYTPVQESRKRAAKALIDIGFDRLGTVVGAGLVALILATRPGHVTVFVLVAIIVLSVVAIPLSQRLRTGYIAALEGGLRDTAVAGPTIVVEPEPVAPIEPPPAAGPEPVSTGTGPLADRLRDPRNIADGRELVGGSPESAVAALRELSATPAQPAVAYAIMLLTHRELYAPAFDALCRIAPTITGQLVYVLVDQSADLIVRRRVALVLGKSGTQRAVDGLLLGITDEHFEIRYVCSRALMQATIHNPRLVVDRAKILQALLVEQEHRGRDAEPPVFVPDPLDEGAVFEMPHQRVHADHTLDHVFTVVGLHVDRQQLHMAYRALHQDDARQRGTALEYLQTILPADLRDAVWPFIGPAATAQPRSARAVLAELIRTTGAASRRN